MTINKKKKQQQNKQWEEPHMGWRTGNGQGNYGIRTRKQVSSRILVPPSDLKTELFSHHALEHPRNFWVQTEAALF